MNSRRSFTESVNTADQMWPSTVKKTQYHEPSQQQVLQTQNRNMLQGADNNG